MFTIDETYSKLGRTLHTIIGLKSKKSAQQQKSSRNPQL